MMHIRGRKKEISVLNRLHTSLQAEFLAIYGRRRIGKTYLIRQYFNNRNARDLYFELTGIKDGSMRQQLFNFSVECFRVFDEKPVVKNWLEAFEFLRQKIVERKSPGKIIIFFDELPWLATARSELLPALDHLWNRYLSDDPRIILVVCGSAASWMLNRVVRDKGGLHGRLTAEIRLLPFDLNETKSFLSSRGVVLDNKQLIDVYMAIGGVAKYLTHVEKGKSSLQTVSQLCFEGPLFREFHELYASLFDNAENHITIVKALAEYTRGLTKAEICKATKLKSGGGLTGILNELEESGFIISVSSFGKAQNDRRYRLIDEYSLFYLKWISLAKASGIGRGDPNYWLKMSHSPAGLAWAGYAFEGLCLKHVEKIKSALGISGISTSESEWMYRAGKEENESGVQIDLVIDRADNCVNLCEIKYAGSEYRLTKEYGAILRKKRDIFIEKTQCRKSVFTTMITTYGVKKRKIDSSDYDIELTMSNLF